MFSENKMMGAARFLESFFGVCDEDIRDSRTGPKYVVIKIFLIGFNLQ